MGSARSTTRQVHRYLKSSLWILRDGLAGATGRTVLIVMSDVLGVGLAATSIAAVLLYARQAERGEDLSALGWSLPTGAPRSILLLASFALVGGVLSAASLFYGEVLVHRQAREYQRRCIRRVMRAAGRDDVGSLTAEVEARSGQEVNLQVLATATSKYCAFALRSLIRAMLPLLYTTLAAIALVRIDWRATLMLLAFGVFYMVPLVLINRKVAWQHRRYRQLAPRVMSGLRSGLRALQSTSGPLRDEAVWRPAVLEDPELESMHDALYGRQMATKKVAMLNGTFFVLCLFIIFVVFGLFSSPADVSWTLLLAYVVALCVVWTGIRQVTTSLVTFNRFYHDYDLFALFTAVVRQRTPPRRSVPPAPFEVRIETDGGVVASLVPGRVVLVLDGEAGDRAGLERIAATLLGSATVACRIEDAPRPLVGAAVRAHLPDTGIDGDEGRRDVLRRLDVLEELERLPGGLDHVVEPADLARLSADARFAIATGILRADEPALVVQSLRGWRGLSPAFQQRLLRSLGTDALVLVDAGTETIFHHKLGPLRRVIDLVIAIDAEGVMRSGPLSWLEERRDEIGGMLGGGSPETHVELVEVDEDDEM